MFVNGDNIMREFGTPERVFYLVQAVAEKPQQKENLYQFLCLTDIFHSDETDAFKFSLTNALELGLVSDTDGEISLAVPRKTIETFTTFRKYAADKAFSATESIFCKVSRIYLEHADETLAFTSWSDYVGLCSRNGLNINDNNVFGWRFWASFLGIGYLFKFGNTTGMMPNVAGRLLDKMMSQVHMPLETPVTADVFMSWLKERCPELRGCFGDRRTRLALSASLRTLEKKQVIKLISQPDAASYALEPTFASETNSFSHIIVGGQRHES